MAIGTVENAFTMDINTACKEKTTNNIIHLLFLREIFVSCTPSLAVTTNHALEPIITISSPNSCVLIALPYVESKIPLVLV